MKRRAARTRRWEPAPPPALPHAAHKGQAGRVLLFCGSREMPGAALLAARAAQRAGAGLVTLAAQAESLFTCLAGSAPEAILLDWSALAPRAMPARVGALAQRGDHAWLAGPGLGTGARTRALVEALLARAPELPLVLDADALNVLVGRRGGPRGLGGLERLRETRARVVITPHPGEAERLLGRPVPASAAGRLAAARELAERSGAVCCLKGAGTVVTQADHVYVNATGNPGMATAGAGDVLAGILVAYLAAWTNALDPRWSPFEAAASAVRVHGRSGDLARERRGLRGLVASDLIEFLPAAQMALDPRELESRA